MKHGRKYSISGKKKKQKKKKKKILAHNLTSSVILPISKRIVSLVRAVVPASVAFIDPAPGGPRVVLCCQVGFPIQPKMPLETGLVGSRRTH